MGFVQPPEQIMDEGVVKLGSLKMRKGPENRRVDGHRRWSGNFTKVVDQGDF